MTDQHSTIPSSLSLSSFLLLLLFSTVLVVNSPLGVNGQEVKVEEVRTKHVVFSWIREGDWLGVKDFLVTLTFDSKSLTESLTCTTSNCSCNTDDTFGRLEPCTSLTIEVSGNNISAPLNHIQTAPSGVSNVSVVWVDSPVQVTWVNPDNETGSTCYENTRVNLTNHYNVTYPFTFQHDQESLEYSACARGYATVVLWTNGGDGYSDFTLRYLEPENQYFDIVPTIENVTCTRSGCKDYDVRWDYIPACLGVTKFTITVSGSTYAHPNLSTTSITVTDKSPSERYSTCIKTVDDHYHVLGDYECATCSTIEQNVVNLVAWAPSSDTVKATWDPALCSSETHTSYYVTIKDISSSYGNSYSDNIEETTITYSDYSVNPLTEYRVCVDVYYSSSPDTCTTTRTLPHEVDCVSVKSTGSLTLQVEWQEYYYGHDIMYKVSWGKDLQHSDTTQYKSYTITGYNTTDEEVQVCVAVLKQNLLSVNICYPSKECTSNYIPPSGSVGVIIGVSVGFVLIVCFVVIFILMYAKKLRNPRQQSREVLSTSNGPL